MTPEPICTECLMPFDEEEPAAGSCSSCAGPMHEDCASEHPRCAECREPAAPGPVACTACGVPVTGDFLPCAGCGARMHPRCYQAGLLCMDCVGR